MFDGDFDDDESDGDFEIDGERKQSCKRRRRQMRPIWSLLRSRMQTNKVVLPPRRLNPRPRYATGKP
jgi:hypothetical protein